MHVVTVRFTIRHEAFDRFIVAVRQQRQASLVLSVGCRRFDVAHDGKGTVFLYELYDLAEDFARHLQTSHFSEFAAATAEMIEAKEVSQYRLDVVADMGSDAAEPRIVH